MKLNLGSGKKYLSGYQNIDLYAEKVDQRVDVRNLEVSNESCSEILMIHILEHFNYIDGSALLSNCHKWLRSNGKLIIELPDRDKCTKLISAGLQTDDEELMFRGAKGIMGGRDLLKEEWRSWLIENAELIMTECTSGIIPIDDLILQQKWLENGEPHLFAWTAAELQDVLYDLGFMKVKIDKNSDHLHGGWRVKDRDSRIIAIKGK